GLQRVGRAYREGTGGWLLRGARGLTLASLGLSLVPGRSRIKAVAAALAGTAGAMAYKLGVFHAGKTSSRDPRATFHLQHAERQSREVPHG
ncbi:MAG: NrfD/PsrC family molybdoenzyme membrane anchor subunit, partial [Candidatus Methylomirabilales bacterium]